MSLFLNTKYIIEATGGAVINDSFESFSGVSIDSRTIKDGELFIALKGDNHDGHDFVIEALKKGSGAMIRRNWAENHYGEIGTKTFIVVEDTLKSLHDLARFIRNRFKGSVFAVVGSNGKTTTKELLSCILQTRWNVLKTSGNLNNHIGMPLCMCQLDKHKQVMLLEMGANRPNDIDNLCRIAYPDTAVITNIGYEHIEGFGSLEMVRESELEILSYVKNIAVNADDQFLMEGIQSKYKGNIITFGIKSASADITANKIDFYEGRTGFYLNAAGSSIYIESKLTGLFNVYNCLAAAAAALTADLSLDEIKKGIESFDGVKLRFELKRLNGAVFLNDVYNANPSSMDASISEMMRIFDQSDSKGNKYKRTIVVLGDMLELGDYSIAAHRNLGRHLSELKIDIFIGVGDMMSHALACFTGKGIHAENSTIGGEMLSKVLKEGDLVLIKGSRGMKMENVLAVLERFVSL